MKFTVFFQLFFTSSMALALLTHLVNTLWLKARKKAILHLADVIAAKDDNEDSYDGDHVAPNLKPVMIMMMLMMMMMMALL